MAIITIIKGFKISIGWNLGRKKKSNHLLDPLTSVPIKSTKIKAIKKIMKNIYESTNSLFFSKIEKKNIVNIPTVIKMQCLRKKK